MCLSLRCFLVDGGLGCEVKCVLWMEGDEMKLDFEFCPIYARM